MEDNFLNAQGITKFLSEESGVQKARLDLKSLLILGFMAGAFISFGGMISVVVLTDSSFFIGKALSKILAGMFFSMGLLLVLLSNAELFTGNSLMLISLFNKKITFIRLLRNWFFVYLANFLGSMCLAILLFYSGIWKNDQYLYAQTIHSIALKKVSLPIIEAFFRGVLCNWLVCLAIWMSFSSKAIVNKFFAILLPITSFIALSFEHSVANMFILPFAYLTQTSLSTISIPTTTIPSMIELNWTTILSNNLLPVSLGNIVGGVFFVSFIFWLAYCHQKL
ncbi:MAG TPA: formate/nitrite transporter family protein [Caldisericia bacterium]|nr:formate/nitrite transporter family protein [Caldisericia bacterium]